jgi:transcription antitermination factor NusG
MIDEQSFTQGEMVKIISGPFAIYTGKIEAVNKDKQMLKVTVSLENNPLVRAGTGEAPVELGFREVMKTPS